MEVDTMEMIIEMNKSFAQMVIDKLPYWQEKMNEGAQDAFEEFNLAVIAHLRMINGIVKYERLGRKE